MTAPGYDAAFDVRRNGDGSYTVSAGNGAHHFPTVDDLMAAYATVIRRAAAIEQAYHTKKAKQ